MNKSVTIKEGQTIEDLSLQLYGTVERVFDVVALIGVDNLSSKIAGITFSYEVDTSSLPSEIRARGLRFATKDPVVTGYLIQKSGYYIIQKDGYKIKI